MPWPTLTNATKSIAALRYCVTICAGLFSREPHTPALRMRRASPSALPTWRRDWMDDNRREAFLFGFVRDHIGIMHDDVTPKEGR